jgi:glutaminase
MEKLLDNIIENNIKWAETGKTASYIPELSKVNPSDAGIAIATLNGDIYYSGKYETKFTIQSISKVITLMLAISDKGQDYVFSKIGMEPTGDPFNSIVNLETKNGHRPLNPMINSGAIATVSIVCDEANHEPYQRILDFIRKLSQNPTITINESIYLSEKITGHRNRSLAYFMKDSNVIDGDVEAILDIYFKQCSIEVTCVDIANIGLVLANDGVIPSTGERVISQESARIVKSIMVTCGMYDASGEFAVHVGVPAKSGVGGGILACVPKRMGIGTYGAALDKKGNSVVGVKMLQELSKALDLSIY